MLIIISTEKKNAEIPFADNYYNLTERQTEII